MNPIRKKPTVQAYATFLNSKYLKINEKFVLILAEK